MGIFGPPDMNKMRNRGDVKGLIKIAEKKNNPALQNKAIEVLGNITTLNAVEPLIEALMNQNWEVHKAAAKALGRIGDPRAIEPLVKIFAGSWERMDTCTKMLRKMGDARTTDPLVASLETEERKVRMIYAQALSNLKWRPSRDETGARYCMIIDDWNLCAELGEAAVDSLLFTLTDKELYMRRHAVETLGKIGSTRAINPLIKVLKDKDKYMRQAAVCALGSIGDSRAIEPLIAVLKDDVLQVTAAEALGKLGWKPDKDEEKVKFYIMIRNWDKCAEIGKPAIEPLVAAIRNKDQDVRKGAGKALVKIADANTVDLLFKYLDDKDKDLQSTVSSILKQIWKPDNDEERAKFYIMIRNWDKCAEIGKLAIEPLVAAIRNKNQDVRKDAENALMKIADANTVDLFIRYLDDEDKAVQASASSILKQIGKPAINSLISSLTNRKGKVRGYVIEMLGELKDVRAVEPLIALLKNSDTSSRAEVAQALGKIGDPSAVEPLIAVLQDGIDTQHVGAAVEALGMIGDARAIEPIIDILKQSSVSLKHVVLRNIAAKSLFSLYESGRLSYSQKQMILQEKPLIAKGHFDSHQDRHGCFGHDDDGVSIPGTGIDFPL